MTITLIVYNTINGIVTIGNDITIFSEILNIELLLVSFAYLVHNAQ